MRMHVKNAKNINQMIKIQIIAPERNASQCVRLLITFVKVEIVQQLVRCHFVSHHVEFSIIGRIAPDQIVQYVRHTDGQIEKIV